MRPLLPLLAFSLGIACDNPSGPSNVDVSGMWHITFSNLSNAGISCSSDTGSMSLSMSGVRLSGSYGPLTLSCTNVAGTFQDTLQGEIVNGAVGITGVSFDLDTQNFHQVGETSGCLPGECDIPPPYNAIYMSGTAQWTAAFGGGPTTTLSGTWSASKQ